MPDDATPEHPAAARPSGGRPTPAPDLNATGVPGGLPPTTPPGGAGPSGSLGPGREAREREAAWRRGAERRQAREQAREQAGERGQGPDAAPAPRAERLADRRALQAAERAFPALAEHVRDYAIFPLDPDGLITYWGEGARVMKWWTRDEAEGAHLRLLYPEGGAEDGTAEGHLAEAAAKGESVGEGQRVRRDGSTFWAGVTLTALRDADGDAGGGEQGALLGFAKVTRDLTARRAADAALLRAAAAERAGAAAEAVSAAKSQFIATMSHEIRTPINAVLGYADLLATEIAGPLTEAQRGYVERLRTSGRHLLGLVNEVLDLSRLEAEQAAAGRADADAAADTVAEQATGRLGDVVAAALALVEPQARQRGLVLADEVGAHAAGTAYRGDEARVRQILVNLLGNAVKFAEARDGAPARVTASAGATTEPPAGVELPGEGPWAYVRVEDTGPGIAADQQAAVFEPFVQVGRRHNNPAAGAGLGLAISRRLARAMGGEIGVESTPGVGATFVLWLPVAAVASVRTGGA